MQEHVFFAWLIEIAGEYFQRVGVPMRYLYVPEWLITRFHYEGRFSGVDAFCLDPIHRTYRVTVRRGDELIVQFIRAEGADCGLYAVGSVRSLVNPHFAVVNGKKPLELVAPLVFHTPMINARPSTYVQRNLRLRDPLLLVNATN